MWSRLRISLLSLLAGLLLILGNTPFFIPLVPFVGFALLFYTSSHGGLKQGFIAGLVFSVYHSLWILNLETPPHVKPLLFLGVGLLSLAMAFVGWGIWAHVFRKTGSVFLAATLWVLIEFWRTELLLDLSYGWALMGLSLLKSPFVELASLGGVYMLSFLVVLVGGLLYKMEFRKAAFVLVISLVYCWLYSPPDPRGELKALVLQPNVLPRLAYDPQEWAEVEEAYEDLVPHERFDLVVAPESAFPGIFPSERAEELVDMVYSRTKAPLLFGAAAFEKTGSSLKLFNRAFVVLGDSVLDHYDKVKLVPFGENLPFYYILPQVIRDIDLGQGNYSRGEGFYPVELNGLKLGVMICYESIFPSVSLQMVKRGADVLVVITSDGWFGRSLGPVEHYHLGILRAVETGRALIRSAKTGISAVVLPTGEVLEEIWLYERGYISARVPLYDYKTPFVVFGWTFPYLLFLISSLKYLLVPGWRNRKTQGI